MNFFDKVKTQANNIGNTISSTASKLSDELFQSIDENLMGINTEIEDIQRELALAYADIGEKYVEYITKSQNDPEIDVSDVLDDIKSKLTRKQELENEIVAREKFSADQFVNNQKSFLQKQFNNEKEKLDKALRLDIITKSEYKSRLAKAELKLINFDEIIKIKKKYEMKIITKEEMKEKLSELGVD